MSTPDCVVVTGVSRVQGIGSSIAVALLDAGFSVCGLDHKPLESQPCHRHPLVHLGPRSGRFLFVDWESGDLDSTNLAAQKISSYARGRLVGLVNCAAVSVPYMPDTMAGSEARLRHFQAVMKTNLEGPFLLTEMCTPHFVSGRASVVHISSTRAKQSEPNCEAYASSKAGLLGLSHSQAISLGSLGVRVNVVLAGWIATRGESSASDDEDRWHPVGRIGAPKDIASMCLFLLDHEQSGFITGQEFVVDGGVNKKMHYTR